MKTTVRNMSITTIYLPKTLYDILLFTDQLLPKDFIIEWLEKSYDLMDVLSDCNCNEGRILKFQLGELYQLIKSTDTDMVELYENNSK